MPASTASMRRDARRRRSPRPHAGPTAVPGSSSWPISPRPCGRRWSSRRCGASMAIGAARPPRARARMPSLKADPAPASRTSVRCRHEARFGDPVDEQIGDLALHLSPGRRDRKVLVVRRRSAVAAPSEGRRSARARFEHDVNRHAIHPAAAVLILGLDVTHFSKDPRCFAFWVTALFQALQTLRLVVDRFRGCARGRTMSGRRGSSLPSPPGARRSAGATHRHRGPFPRRFRGLQMALARAPLR